MNRSPIRINAPVILIFTMLCFGVFGLNLMTNGRTNYHLFSVYRSSLLDPLYYVRMVTHVFGHANWAHLSGNMMYILLLGPMLEEKYGSWNIAVIIGLTAVSTGTVHELFFSTSLLGASGVVFAFIILSSITSMKDKKIPLTFLIVVIIFLGGELIDGIFIRSNVSNLTHILGGVVGGGCGYLLNIKK